jgi:hypothetical protein
LRARSGDADADLTVAGEGLLSLMEPDDCSDPEAWPLLNACLPHARALLGASASGGATAEVAIALGLRLGILLGAQGLLSEAEAIERTTLDLARETLGAEHPERSPR